MRIFGKAFIAFGVSIALINISLGAAAQEYAPFKYDTESEIYDNIWKSGGELYMYDFPEEDDIKTPKGYKPFYISMFGRHGARYVHETGMYSDVYSILSSAHNEGKLNSEGELLFERYKDFFNKVAYREGDLTVSGQKQWRKAAACMFKNYPEVFRGHTSAIAVSTYFQRTMMSMFSFVDEIQHLDRSLDCSIDAGNVFLPYLLPNSSKSPQYVKGKPLNEKALKSQKDFFASKIDALSFAKRYFNDTDYVGNKYGMWKFMSDLALCMLDIQCLEGVENPFGNVFTKEELFAFWEVRNYNGYLYLGSSPLTDGKNMLASSAGLREIIESADKDMESGTVDLRLRFSHDSAILPMMSFMRLNNFGIVIDNPEELKNYWRSFDIPMASNLQFIFYKSKRSDEILLKLLYNGKPASIPIKPAIEGYYSWNDFKSYYIPRIEDAEKSLSSK